MVVWIVVMKDVWWLVGVVGEGMVKFGGVGWWAWVMVCRSGGDPPTFPPGVWPEKWPVEERPAARPKPPVGVSALNLK